MNKLLGLLFVLALLVAGSVGALLYYGDTDGPQTEVLIPRGTSASAVAEILKREGVFAYPSILKLALRVPGASVKLRAGEYRFRKGSRMADVLTTLFYDEPIRHSATVPEGWTIRLIARMLADQRLVNEQKFLALALSPKTARKYQLKAPSLEGFLFPDTYQISRIDGEERILDQMVQNFFRKFDDKLRAEAKGKGWSVEQLVTLASIIEKETGSSGEREIISSVFHNRLKKKMRLQSDPTTIYGIPNFNGNITKKDLLTPTAYNTYTIPALPPGAIASPGLAALMAAMRPATTNYLYFVSNNHGGHIFSETYSQHSGHVNTFQKRTSNRQPESTARRPATRIKR